MMYLEFLPQSGAAVGGAGNGTSDVWFTDDGLYTYVAIENDDDGVLQQGNDVLLRFDGIHTFAAADFI